MMMIAFITINSGVVPLIEGLCAQVLPSLLVSLHSLLFRIRVGDFFAFGLVTVWVTSAPPRHGMPLCVYLYVHVPLPPLPWPLGS